MWGINLQRWTAKQKQRKNTLSARRVKLLDDIGFIWKPHENKFEQGLYYLNRFKKRETHCIVPNTHIEEGFKLGGWVSKRRQRKETLTSDQIKKLDALGFIWNSLEEKWLSNLVALKIFKNREKHCLVPKNHIEGDLKLGIWVGTQRSDKRKNKISKERIKKLEELGFHWVVRG